MPQGPSPVADSNNASYTLAGAPITADGALPAPSIGKRRGVAAYCTGIGGTMVLVLKDGSTTPWTVVPGTQDRGIAAVSITGIPAGTSVQSLY